MYMYMCVYMFSVLGCIRLVHFMQNAVDDVRMVLVGNKIDLENQRVVTEKRGRKVNNYVYACHCNNKLCT